MPFDSGLCTGVKHGTRPRAAATVERLFGGEGTQHQIAHHRARPPHAKRALPVMGIDDEDDADDLSIPGGDLEDIGAPTQVRAHHYHLAVVQAALAAAGMALK